MQGKFPSALFLVIVNDILLRVHGEREVILYFPPVCVKFGAGAYLEYVDFVIFHGNEIPYAEEIGSVGHYPAVRQMLEGKKGLLGKVIIFLKQLEKPVFQITGIHAYPDRAACVV